MTKGVPFAFREPDFWKRILVLLQSQMRKTKKKIAWKFLSENPVILKNPIFSIFVQGFDIAVLQTYGSPHV